MKLEKELWKREKRVMERKYRKTPTSENLNQYRIIKNEYTSKLKSTIIEYYASSIEKSKTDSKTLYKTVHELTGYKKERILPSYSCDDIIAEDMAEYFVNKITKIRQNLEEAQLQEINNQLSSGPKEKSISELSCFKPINTANLKITIQSLQKKFCLLDPIPTTVLMQKIDLLLPFMCEAINTSIEECTFPQNLKKAVITPIIKDSTSDRNNLRNYRPVSCLSFMSKIFEKVLYNQIYNHLKVNKLQAKYQSAYKPHHSCETALAKITNDIGTELSDGKNVLLVLLDSSAAFDTVDHGILLDRLNNEYLIKGKALQLIASYLKERSFKVTINASQSSSKILDWGVPQGSLLGPIFYNLYA